MQTWFAIFAVMVCLACARARAESVEQDFRTGLSAFDSGDYTTALRLWELLAAGGEPRAQAGLGFMYHRGLGVAVDDRKAADWLTRAAKKGQADAQLTLGTLYFYGKGVPRDYIHAYAWCDLAQSGGAADASICRDAALQMLPDDADMRAAFDLVDQLRTIAPRSYLPGVTINREADKLDNRNDSQATPE